MDLNDLSLNELKKLRSDVDKAISSYEDRLKKDALAAAQAAAKEHGFDLGELLYGTASKRKPKVTVAPKYAHPENSSLTWTGRGRQPKWIKEALGSGKMPTMLETMLEMWLAWAQIFLNPIVEQ
jgi:DNA-binding protein H-NS